MLPLLQAVSDGRDHRTRDLVPQLADALSVPEEERRQLLSSGRSTILYSRIQWAKTYLKQAGLVDTPSSGIARITDEGRKLLSENPKRVDSKSLLRYPAFVDFRSRSRERSKAVLDAATVETVQSSAAAPEEVMEAIVGSVQQSVAEELLQRIAAMSPAFFEHLVVRLLVAMGYGGSYAEAAQVVGQSGDQGIDGVIKEDRLGLDLVYIQAKRWQGIVGRPDVQAFAGSLEGARARKGVFITTSSFTRDAHDYVERIEKRIVLIDGRMLADLMIEHGVGVVPDRTYVVPRVDLDFFEEA